MPTIELYGAGGLGMTPQLTKALERYVKNCYSLNNEWNFIGTNLDKAVQKDQSEPLILSIPVYFQNEESGFENNPFFSFEKIIIDKKDQKYISDFSHIFCDDDNLMTEKNGGIAVDTSPDDKFCKKVNLILENIEKIPTSHEGMKIRTLNIQSGDIKFWNKELKKVFSSERKNTFYIFYWNKHHVDVNLENELEIEKSNPEFLKKTKNRYEIHDRVWGFSKFMRDYLKIRSRCYELELSEIKKFTFDDFKYLIKLKKDKIVDDLLQEEVLVANAKNLLSYFNLQKDNFDCTDLACLHLYNRNQFFTSGYFEDTFRDFNTTSKGNAHQILQQKDNLLLNPKDSKTLGALESKLFFYDLFKNITDSCIYFKELNAEESPDFIFLDDIDPTNLSGLYLNKYKRLKEWFPNSDIYYSDDRKFLDKLFNNQFEDKLFNFNSIPVFVKTDPIPSFKKITNKPLFIGIDIDWKGEQYGFELLKQFRRSVHLLKRPCFIFVFSRYEYPATIRKAVASGALFYVTKQNYLNLVHKVYQIMRQIKAEEIVHSKYRTYESWHLLNKLEPAKVVQLKSDVIEGFPVCDQDLQSKKQGHQWKWIRRLPKADLHCHIGSCLGPDLLPLTAILVLSEKMEHQKVIKDNLNLIIRFISIVVNGLQLSEKNEVILNNSSLIDAFGFDDTKYVCVFNLLIQECKLTDNLIFPEVVLINPKDTVIDRMFSTHKNHPYFSLREKLRKAKIEYDDLILFLIFFIYIKERSIKDYSELHANIKKDFAEILPERNSFKTLMTNLIKTDGKISYLNIGRFIKLISKEIDSANLWKEVVNGKINLGLLKNLQTTKGKSNSLFTYLRGCEYGGAAHLQTRLSIYLACYYIVHHYAAQDNIRYLTLRCAVDGYSKSGILTNDTAMQALLNGFDKAVDLTKQRIHVDLILTAKRHKSIKEFEENVSLALQYRNGLNLPKGFDNNIDETYFKTKTKVVSFDLAGLEEGNRASKYLPQFMPLLKKCFPITIHAGEEDDHEAIWEAIYLVQSQRIGHGLTLRDNPDLIELVRDRHIAIELCPLSNILTRKVKYDAIPLEYRNDKSIYKDQTKNYYPLRQYLMENLDVTINTDNPFVSGSTLTEEYLVAAFLAGGLTKWEILRLVKNSFRSAAIPKEHKKMLMNEIDDEIYNLLFEE